MAAYSFSPDEANALLAKGLISDEEHQRITQSQSAANSMGVGADMGIDPSWTKAPSGGAAPVANDWKQALPSNGSSAAMEGALAHINKPIPSGVPSTSPSLASQFGPTPGSFNPVSAPPKPTSDATLTPDAHAPQPAAASTPQPSATPPRPTSQAVGPARVAPVTGPSADPRVNRALSNYRKERSDLTEAEGRLVEEQEKELAIQNRKLELEATRREQFAQEAAEADSIAGHDREAQQREMQDQYDATKRALREAADARVDPNHFWASKDTNTQMLGAIAIAVGQIGAAMSRTPNIALGIIDNAIDRDIKAQEKAIDSKFKNADAQRSLMGDEMRIYQTKEQARAAARSEMYQRAQNELDAMTARSASAVGSQHTLTLKKELEAKKAAADFEVLQGFKQQYAKIDAQVAAAALARNDKLAARADHMIDEYIKEGREVPADIWARSTLGKAGVPADAQGLIGTGITAGVPKNEQAAALKEYEDRSKVESGIAEVRRLIQQWKETPVWEQGKRSSIQAALKTIVKKSAGPGMSSDADREQFIDPLVPSATKMDSTIDADRDNIIAGLRASAPTPVLSRYGKTIGGPANDNAAKGPVGPAKLGMK